MSTPLYDVRVISKHGSTVRLHIEATTAHVVDPWTEGVYPLAKEFALGLIFDCESDDSGAQNGPLHQTLAAHIAPDKAEVIEQIATGNVDATPYIATVDWEVDDAGDRYAGRWPTTFATITVTDPRWIAHLQLGSVYASFAWYHGGESLQIEEVVPKFRLPEPFPLGARVQVRGCGGMAEVMRGTIEETEEAPSIPKGWKGGRIRQRVRLDDGNQVWLFVEAIFPVVRDAYEEAWEDPARWFRALLGKPPLERALALRPIVLHGGGMHGDKYNSFDVRPDKIGVPHVAINGGILFTIARRLPFEQAFEFFIKFYHDWIFDEANRSARVGKDVEGQGLTEGQFLKSYYRVYDGPVSASLGAMVYLMAFRYREQPFDTLRGVLPADCARVLQNALEKHNAVIWSERDPQAVYLRRCLDGMDWPPPESFLHGLRPDRVAVIGPFNTDLDRFRVRPGEP
jgi:hypothetical protein